jgi:hypothetical protein
MAWVHQIKFFSKDKELYLALYDDSYISEFWIANIKASDLGITKIPDKLIIERKYRIEDLNIPSFEYSQDNLMFGIGDFVNRFVKGRPQMSGDTYNFGQAGAVGKYARSDNSINIKDSNVGGFSTGDGEVSVSQVSQAIATNLPDITQILKKLKADAQSLPDDRQEPIEVYLDDLSDDIADEKKRTPKRIATRLIAIWGILCAIAAGTAGVADFSNNILELSEKLNVPIPIELIQQNPHILTGG